MQQSHPSFEASPLSPELRIGAKSLPDLFASISMTLLVGFLGMTVFEGAIRYYAAKAGFPWLVYGKDVLLIGALALGCLNTLLINLRNAPFFVVLIFIFVGTLVGCSILPEIKQPLFAVKTWLPLLCGTAVGSSMDIDTKLLRRSSWFLWAAAVGGIFLTSKWHAPWVGFLYDVGGVTVEGSREWTIGEADRVAGFSRASFDAALQCLFLGIIIVSGVRFYLISLGVWILSGAAIYLTLSRSALAALLVAAGLHFLMVIPLPIAKRLAKFAVIALAAAVLIIPFASAIYYKNKAAMSETTNVASTSSFEERATKTWPDAFALTKHGGTWLFGRGLGGIGVAQQYFERSIFNPGDNYFVYLWGAFGLLGVGFLALIPILAWKTYLPLNKNRQIGLVIAGTFLAVGLTLNAIEAAIASLFLGLALVWLTDRRATDETFT